EDLLLDNFVYSGSVMLRKEAFDDFPRWVYDAPFADYPLWIQAARHGDIGFIKEFLGVWRDHGGGAWSGKSAISQVQGIINVYEHLRGDLGSEYARVFERVFARFYAQLACEHVGVPERSSILVVSAGDPELLKLYRE